MKKIIAMLLVVSIFCVGCGGTTETADIKDAETATENNEEVTEEEKKENVTSDSAIEAAPEEASNEGQEVSEPEEPIDEVDEGDPAVAEENADPHVISIHENAAPEETGDYFIDQSYINDRERMMRTIWLQDSFGKYDYTIEYRTFDFLTTSAEDGANVTETNLRKIAEKIKEEYFKDTGISKDAVDVIGDVFTGEMSDSHVIYISEKMSEDLMENMPDDYVRTGDYIIIHHTEEDPANGVTVTTVKDCELWDAKYL